MQRFAWKLLMLAIAALACAAGLWGLGWALRPNLQDKAFHYSAREVAAAKAARDVSFKPSDRYSLYVQKHVTPRGQSPILKKLVKQGRLPPLKERMPGDPAVMRGVDGIGQYGGTWLMVANTPSDVSIIGWRISGSTLVRWSPLGYPIEPHIAQSVTPSHDDRVWTVALRPGLKWSDGKPYTADDIMYWWRCEATNPNISTRPPSWMRTGNHFGRIEKIDRYHVKFIFHDPYPLFLEALTSDQASVLCDTPAHYLRPYNPDPAIGDKAKIQAAMRAYQLPSPLAVYFYLKAWNNPQCPRLWPWIYHTYKASPPQVFVRNPYYYVVDTKGNQLPYIDRVQFNVQDNSMLAMTAANGGVSMQLRHIEFQDYTELMSRRKEAHTRILHWYPATRSRYVISPNLNRKIIPGKPATKWKAKLLKDKRFREALSLAIHREEIIRAQFMGIGKPSQVAPGPQSRFTDSRLANAFVQYDPKRANELLDELGLTRRDSDGYRTFPNGQRMIFYLDYTQFTGAGPTAFLVDDWQNVGLHVIARQISRSLFYVEKGSHNFDMNVWTGESDMMPLLSPRYYIAYNTEANYAIGWGKWFEQGGMFGMKDADRHGAIPVPSSSPMYQAMKDFVAARQSSDPVKQKALVRKVLDIAAKNTWSISITTPPPRPVVVSDNMRNVPSNALAGAIYSTPANAGIETYYFAHPHESAGAVAGMTRAITHITPRPTIASTRSGSGLGRALRILFWVLGAIVVALIATRHPFIGKRLLVLIPELVVISVIVFTIIQLPPGDYLSQRIMQLQETGDQTAIQQIKDLRNLFHYKEPQWKQYLRWTGIRWFWTYDDQDMGLLQGDLGRSMQTAQPVNRMVGDRIILTIAIASGTILFTWLLAIPIGIYSAVRQYSISDYALTLVGFIGMCVPPFLLALVLMAVSDVSGLFSPQYAAQPEWTTGKVMDLLAHIWIPIVVLGVGGTAGMIRIMRANLLDELRKPYVTTALAKGMRPTRVLMKYPVRMALNPFVSGIGHLFPRLISGGAIVAMVLALPTVGPMLLSALFGQDMYLAGSLLMVLSLLGVLGTLVSDLLLLWLDPRIRFEGGGR